jgi:hypothetical protein
VELWINILEEACRIPGKDEFGTDPRGYWEVPYDQPAPSSRITSEELEDALSTRLTVALVCKSWHSVGLPILHSHIRPHFTSSDTSLVREYSWIIENVKLRDRVRRVSITLGRWYKRGCDAEKIVSKLIFVLSLLSRPVILSAPRTVFWQLPPDNRSSIVIADLTGAHDTSLDMWYTEGWKNLRFFWTTKRLMSTPPNQCLSRHSPAWRYGSLAKEVAPTFHRTSAMDGMPQSLIRCH